MDRRIFLGDENHRPLFITNQKMAGSPTDNMLACVKGIGKLGFVSAYS